MSGLVRGWTILRAFNKDMCGLYTLRAPPSQIATLFELAGSPPKDWRPRYKIAPTQDIPVVRVARSSEPGGSGGRVLEMMRWGLVAPWAKSCDDGPAPINARGEDAASKPMFRNAMKHGRCLIPCDGFYEWKKLDGAGKRKQPMFIRLKGGEPFALAGLWERWQPKGVEGQRDQLHSCTILTTEPNSLLTDVHNRMPAVVPREQWGDWLDPDVTDAARVQGILRPLPAERMEMWPVGRGVNRPGGDGPSLIEPVEAPAGQDGIFDWAKGKG